MIKENNVLNVLLNENLYFTFKYDENNKLFFIETNKELMNENGCYINKESLFNSINNKIQEDLGKVVKGIKNKSINLNF